MLQKEPALKSSEQAHASSIVVGDRPGDSLFQTGNLQDLTGRLVTTFRDGAKDGDVSVSVSVESDPRWLVERKQFLRLRFGGVFLAERN